MKAGDILTGLGLSDVNPGTWSGDGGWLARPEAPLIESVNPATGEVIAKVRAATPADYERVMAAAAGAFRRWRLVPAPQRGEAIRRVGLALREKKDLLGSLVTLEMGKIKAEGDGEVQEMIDVADFAVGQSRMLYGLTMHSERPEHRMYEQWHPLGVVGIISAFNFPVAVWAWNAFIAAVCGDASVWKPSPKAPLCAIAVQRICNAVLEEMDLPPVFQLFVTADNSLAERFVDDRRVALVSFTGSTPVGRTVAQRVAARLGKSLLELGGNNAIIVDEHANLDLVVPAVVFGAVGTAGQRCTTTRRLLVHATRIDEVERRLAAAYAQLRIGDPLDPSTLVGPVVARDTIERFEHSLAAAREQSGRLVCGGRVLPGPGFYVEPTIVRARNDMPVVRHETFAPILYTMSFDSLEEAIDMQNDTDYGLSSAIFTDRLQHAERFLSAAGSDCGIANVNIGTSGAEIGGAFGGEKDTGGGRESGSDAWKAYMRRQTNTVNYSSKLPLAQGIKFEV
jgi:aldehyde dehydrogenase (NAD+)